MKLKLQLLAPRHHPLRTSSERRPRHVLTGPHVFINISVKFLATQSGSPSPRVGGPEETTGTCDIWLSGSSVGLQLGLCLAGYFRCLAAPLVYGKLLLATSVWKRLPGILPPSPVPTRVASCQGAGPRILSDGRVPPGSPALGAGGQRRRNRVWIVQSRELADGKFLPASRVSDSTCRIPFSQTGCVQGIASKTVIPLSLLHFFFPFLMGLMPAMP